MFKLIVLVFAAILAVAAARPGYLASSPVLYSSQVYQPYVKTHYTAVPVVKHVVTPVVRTYAAPVYQPIYRSYHSYPSVPVVSKYAPAYVPFKRA